MLFRSGFVLTLKLAVKTCGFSVLPVSVSESESERNFVIPLIAELTSYSQALYAAPSLTLPGIEPVNNSKSIKIMDVPAVNSLEKDLVSFAKAESELEFLLSIFRNLKVVSCPLSSVDNMGG